jgi:general secretion pathway protein H
MTSRFSRPAGFTLVELLIVLAIMAAAIVWLMTNFRVGTTSAELRAETREFQAASDETRSLAITQDRITAMVVDAKAGLYREPHGLHRLPSDIALVVRGGDGTIYFFPDGSSSGGEITFAADRASEAVSIDWLTGCAITHALQPIPR